MYVIVQQRNSNPSWLMAFAPPQWGDHERAIRFETRRDAQRAAAINKVSGDWSIEASVMCDPPKPVW